MRVKTLAVCKAIILGFSFDALPTLAAPEDGTVTAGSATISGENSSTTTTTQINQTSQKAIIQWQSFNVAQNESVNFHTPGASAITLNRISGNASQIFGHVTSNGQLWLLNSNGIIFGQGSQVNAAGLLASTLNITDQNFLNGNYHFIQDPAHLASIINRGNLSADGGYVALLAPQIENTGIVSAHLGTVAMGAGTEATLNFDGNQLLNIAVPQGSHTAMYDENGNAIAALSNSGTITADGGQVLLNAQSVNTLLDESINITGIIKADTVSEAKGKIILTASGNTILDNAQISAQGLNTNEKGGSVEVLGQNVGLFNNTSINASGAAGGGQIHVGWDKDDLNAIEAQQTVIDSTVALQATATQSGDGGFIETSGHYLNSRTGNVSTRARKGKNGTWLLDPYDIDITSSQSDSSGGWNGGNTTFDSGNSAVEPSYVNTTTLENNLASNNITIQTGGASGDSGNITVSNDVAWSSGNSLTLDAYGSIILDAALIGTSDATPSGTPNATVNLTAQHGAITDDSGTGSIIAATTNLTAGGSGGINLSNGSNDFGTVNFTASASGAGVALEDVNGLTVTGTTNGGAVSVISNADGSGTGTLMVGSAGIDTTDAGSDTDGATISLTDNGTAGGGISLAGNLDGGGSSDNDLVLTSQAGDITQTAGTITTRANGPNGFSVSTGGSGAINLNDSSNQILGGTNLFFTTAGGDITLNNSAAADIDGNFISMNIKASDGSSRGNITLMGSGNGLAMLIFSVSGPNGASLDVNNQNGDVNLINNSASFDFSGDISVTSGGTVDVNQILDSSTGNITLAGATVSLNNNVALSTIAGKTLTISGAQDGDGTGTINTVGSVQFNNVSGDDLALAWATTVAQNLGITLAGSGNLTQAEALVVSGTTTLTGGSNNNITLTNTANDFYSMIGSGSLGSVSVKDVNGLNIGSLTATGPISVTANTTTSNTGLLDAAGTLTATGQSVTLINSSTAGTGTMLNIENSITASDLTLSTASGNIVQDGGSITSTGTTTLTGGTITLDSTSNDFATVTGSGLGATTLKDVNALILGTLSASGLTVTTATTHANSGAITQSDISDILRLTGPSSFTNSSTSATAADKAITLANTSNNFDHQAVTLSAGGAINIADSNGTGLSLGTVSSGALTATAEAGLTASSGITATGDVSLTANTSSPLNAGVLTVGGNINASANSVSLRNNSTTSGGTNAISLTGGTLIAGALNLTVTSGNINQSTSGGHIAASGVTTLSNSGTTTLTANTNDFATVTGSGLGATTLKDLNSLILGNLGASALTVTTGNGVTVTGALTQSGVLTLTGPSSFTNSSTLSTAGAKDITLSNLSNTFGHQVVTLSAGGTINIADNYNTGLSLGTVSSGALTALAKHDLTVGNAITASGNVSLTANSSSASNTGVLSVAGNINAGANSVSLNNSSTAITSSNNAISLTGGTLTAGALNLTVASGNINQSGGNIVASGTTTISNAHTTTLNQSTNDFATVTGSGLGATTLEDANALILSTLGASGLTVTTGAGGNVTGALTQSGVLTLTGPSSFTNSSTSVTSGYQDITLTNISNNFGHQAVTLSGNNLNLTDNNNTGLVVGAITSAAATSLTARAGTLTDGVGHTGSIIAGTSTTLTAHGNIDLENTSNSMHNITASSSTGRITLVDSGLVNSVATPLTLTNLSSGSAAGVGISVNDLGSALVVAGAVNADGGSRFVSLTAAGGSITDGGSHTGSIKAAATTLSANGAIDLENSLNEMSSITATTTGTSSAQNITLVDSGKSGGTASNLLITSLNTSANNGDISLTDLNTNSGGNFSLVVNGAVNAGTGTVKLTAEHGAITDDVGQGSIVASATTLTAGSSADDTNAYIDLENSSNKFGTLSATAYGIDGSGNSITAVDGNTSGLALGNIIADGNLTLTASGDVTQAASTTIDMTSGIAGANTASFDIATGQSGSVTLLNNNDFNQNTVSAGGAGLLSGFSLFDNDSSGLYLGNVNAGDNTHAAAVNVTAAHGFNQVADTTVSSHGGDVSFKTIAGGTNIHQDGAVSTDGGGMLLDFNYSGTVAQDTIGNIDTSDGAGDYGLVEVRSDGYGYSMEADFDNVNSANNFQQLAFENIAGHAMQVNATVKNNNSLAFGLFYGTAPIGGADSFNQLNIDTSAANGAVTKLNSAGSYTAEALTVSSGSATINAGTGNITLMASDNDFGGRLLNLTGRTVQVVDNNATGLNLGTISTSGNFTATASQALTLNNTVNVGANTVTLTADHGALTEYSLTAGLIIAAITDLTAGLSSADTGAYIALPNTSNQLGTLTATAYGTSGITITDNENNVALHLNNISSVGAVFLFNGSGITQNSGTTLSTSGSGSSVSLSATSNITQQGTIDTHAGNGDVFLIVDSSITPPTVTQSGSSGGINAGTGKVYIENNYQQGINVSDTVTLNASNNQIGQLFIYNDNTTPHSNTEKTNLTVHDTSNLTFGLAYHSGNTTPMDSFTNLNITTTGNATVSQATTNPTSSILLETLKFSGSSGTPTINTGTGNITLGTSTNDFNNLVVALTGGAINIADANTTGLKLGAVTASGDFTATATHALSLTGALGAGSHAVNLTGSSISESGSGAITTSGTTTLTSAGTINLNGSNDFATVVGSGTLGALTLDDINGLSLGAMSLGGALNVTANTTVTNTGALTVAGNVNAGTNTVSLTNDSTAIGSSSNAINFSSGTLTAGTLSLTANSGEIVESGGNIAASGTTTITNSGTTNLNSSSNDFGTVTGSGLGATTLEDTNALILGELGATGLTVTTGAGGNVDGALTQSGALTLTGPSSFTNSSTSSTSGYQDITLTNSSNNFGDSAVALSGGNVQLIDANTTGLILGVITADTLNVTSNAAITQTAAMNVSGEAIFTAGSAHDITLSNSDNAINLLQIVSGDNVSVTDSSALALDASTISGNLDLALSNGMIQVGGVTSVTGTTTVSDSNTGTTDLISLSQGDFTGAVSVTGAHSNVAMINDKALNLGASTVGGNLSATASGDITQSGASILDVSGTSAFDAGTHTISLGNLNTFGGTVTLGHTGVTAGAVTIATGSGAMTLAQVDNNTNTKLSALSVNSAGGISEAGPLVVTGTTTLAAGNNDIDLTSSNNNFGGAVSLTGNNVSLTQQSGNNLTVDNINAEGNVTVNDSDGTLTFTGTSPTISLRNAITNKLITLIAKQFVNQNTGNSAAIDLGTGTGNYWNFYISNLTGNTFGNLLSGNQAIWGTSYPTTISQTGNRYIFGTSETLNLVPDTTPFSVSKTQGDTGSLPTPIAGTNYQVTDFVDASNPNYGNAFTQDTLNNISLSGVSYTSTGVPASAANGTYPVNMTGTAHASNGYAANYDSTAAFGELTVSGSTPPIPPTPPVTPAATPANDPAVVAKNIYTPPSGSPSDASGLEQSDSNNSSLSASVPSASPAQKNFMLQSLVSQKSCSQGGGGASCSFTIPSGTSFNQWVSTSPQGITLSQVLSPSTLSSLANSVTQQLNTGDSVQLSFVLDTSNYSISGVQINTASDSSNISASEE